MNKHLHITISGRVQGIGFRFSAYEKFVEFGLQGHASNTPNRDVFLDVEGPEESLNRLIEWCRIGPSGARVSNLEVAEASEPFVPLKNG